MFDFLKRNKQPITGAGHLDAMLDDLKPTLDQDTVLNYLIELTDPDYKKVVTVANLYRNTHKKAAEILGSQELVPVGTRLPSVSEVAAPFIDQEPVAPTQKTIIDVSQAPLPPQGS